MTYGAVQCRESVGDHDSDVHRALAGEVPGTVDLGGIEIANEDV